MKSIWYLPYNNKLSFKDKVHIIYIFIISMFYVLFHIIPWAIEYKKAEQWNIKI